MTFLSTDTLQGSFTSIYPEDLRDLPIAISSSVNQLDLVNLVEEITKIKKELHYLEISDSQKKLLQQKADKIDKEIDQLVYKLYGLTKDEIEIVEKSS